MHAAAKINLDLRITGRRDDGYHLLDSIVVFTEIGDDLTAKPGKGLSLQIKGDFADGLVADENNLVLKAAGLICREANVEPDIGFTLTKNLPVSSGIGGGSADAAAALKLCNDMLGIHFDEKRLLKIALQIGADVPVCLMSRACLMSGIGDILKPVHFSNSMCMLLVNPGAAVSTVDIFRMFNRMNEPFEEKRLFETDEIHLPFMIDQLRESKNSLQNAAIRVNDCISGVLVTLSNLEGVSFYRMSGSGATCFALFENEDKCKNAEAFLKQTKPGWWVEKTGFY